MTRSSGCSIFLEIIPVPTIESPFLRRIALTPEAPRPISRISLSLNLIDWPFPVTSIASSPFSTNDADTSSSPNFNLMATRPLRRTSWKLAAAVFLPTPFLVIINRESLVDFTSFGMGRMEVTFSSAASGRKFMTDFPLVARLPSGISYIFI